MPSEYAPVIPEEVAVDFQQIKLCSRCHSAVDSNLVFLPDAEAIVCDGCRSQVSTFPARQPPPAPSNSFSAFEPPDLTQIIPHSTRLSAYDSVESVLDSPSVSESNNYHWYSPVVPSPSYISKPATVTASHIPPRHSIHSDVRSRSFISPSPLTDITRLRVRSQGNHCLYPGAVFQGTQKSGRSSYDVNVTIVVR
jgi:glucose-induced degradation protein 4